MKKRNTMRQIPADDRPCEKCLRGGPGILSNAELLAVILRTGTRGQSALELADEVLSLCPYADGLAGILQLSAEELQQLPGIGAVKAVQILCIGELSRRISQQKARRSLHFRDPETIADYYMESLRHAQQEELLCVMLDAGGHFLGDMQLTRGTVNASLISPREIFLAALRFQAVQLVLVHNHPSGDCTPSESDIASTKRVSGAGELLGIRLIDHIIIGDRRFCSLRRMHLI